MGDLIIFLIKSPFLIRFSIIILCYSYTKPPSLTFLKVGTKLALPFTKSIYQLDIQEFINKKGARHHDNIHI